ncbi:uncharacterized protein LOC123511938 isoform X2 [Portunus trituberculatus]|uniref:uncharacterized protein LOC123511938 isoform X2 n=1 Tax=Portunus trituberculatus TaxID=210409 RepID=UPI001E1D0603|nr:uncharacterized protein LOC123511938 isoform X2 [Portunus trituberculatus]
MNVIILCLLAVVLARNTNGGLPPPERSYKILMLLPAASKSHKNVFMAFSEALADRGHKVVILSGLPQSSKHSNILEINHEMPYMGDSSKSVFEKGKSATGGLGTFAITLPAMARQMYKIPSVKQLYEKRKEFDLIIVNHMFNEIAYPFVHELPFITVATPGMDPRQSAVLGNILNPSYVPNLLGSYPHPLSLLQRIKNTFMHIVIPFFWRHWAVVPLIQKEISAQFPDLPPLLDIERNQSLTLINTHFSITTPVPLLPSQVEVGGMHCRPAKPLPQKPSSEAEWRIVANDFETRWNFPHCLGSIDGKHIQMIAPAHSGSLYYNYKNTFSIVLLGVADGNYNFLYADVGCQGRISDGGVFKFTSLYNTLENNSAHVPSVEALPGRTEPVPYVLVGDDAFAMSSYLMKPYPGRALDIPKRVFNYRLSRARRIIENVFGIMSCKFRVFLKPIALQPCKVESVVLACIYLHNFLRRNSVSRQSYTPPGSFDSCDTDGNMIAGSWRRDINECDRLLDLMHVPRRASDNLHKIRDEFCSYFVSEQGTVPWQYDAII